jgi:hypothetical protein
MKAGTAFRSNTPRKTHLVLITLRFIKRSSVHNEETLGSVHNRLKSQFMLNARFVLDMTQKRPAQAEAVL